MKLSKAQEKVMEKAKRDIDLARSMDYPEWLKETHDYYKVHPWMSEEYVKIITENWHNAVKEEYLKNYWENERNGIVLTECNSRTLAKLEGYGLIEIIYDSNGTTGGIDTVKVLNY